MLAYVSCTPAFRFQQTLHFLARQKPPKDTIQGRIMNSFSVSNCTYDGTSGSANAHCLVTGTVNGKGTFAQTFFRYLMAAADQMQAASTG
jgi:hypothetical protein